MKYRSQFLAQATPEAVFDTMHYYKLDRNPGRFFPSGLVRRRFRVLTDYTLGPGAIYDWKIWLLGIPVLSFQEQVVAWRPGRRVAYRATSGWHMSFQIDLEPHGQDTVVTVSLDFSLGPSIVGRLLRPFVEWGLGTVCRRGFSREGIPTMPAEIRTQLPA